MNDRDRRLAGTSKLVRLHEDDGSFDREFWSRVPPAERMAAAWDMVLEYLAGSQRGPVPRLQKSVCRLERRRR